MSVDAKKARGSILAEKEFEFTNELCMLYSLSIGFNRDPLNEDEFMFTYENEDEFTTFPAISVLALKTFVIEMLFAPGLPPFDIMMLMHGEQIVESYKPITPGTTVKCIAIMEDIADKGKGALMTVRCDIKDIDTDDLLSTSYMRFYIRGLGGFGDKGIFTLDFPAIPDRAPDVTVDCPTEKNQALLYRLCGDNNPLHVNPAMSSMGGFDVPILHGLCTYGIVGRAVYTTYCDNDPERIKNISSRFTSHVYPGETIIVDLYREGDTILYSARTKERDLQISVGFVTLKPEAKL
jgi:acyl dehydratase